MSNKINSKNLLWTILVLCGILNMSEGVPVQEGGSSVSGSTPPTPTVPVNKQGFYSFVDGSESGTTGYFATISNGTDNLGIYKDKGWTGTADPIFTGITLKIGPKNSDGKAIQTASSYVTIRFYLSNGIPEAEVVELQIGDNAQLKSVFESVLKIYGWVIYAHDAKKYPSIMSNFITTLVDKINMTKNTDAISILNAAIRGYTQDYVLKQFNGILTEANEVEAPKAVVDSQRPATPTATTFSSEAGSEHSEGSVGRRVSQSVGDAGLIRAKSDDFTHLDVGIPPLSRNSSVASLTSSTATVALPQGVEQFAIGTPSVSRASSKESLALAANKITVEKALKALHKHVEENITIYAGKNIYGDDDSIPFSGTHDSCVQIVLHLSESNITLVGPEIKDINLQSLQLLVQAVLEAIIDLEKFEHDLQHVYDALKALFEGIESKLTDQETKLAFYDALNHELNDVLNRSLAKVKAERKAVKPETTRAQKSSAIGKVTLHPDLILALKEEPQSRISKIIENIKSLGCFQKGVHDAELHSQAIQEAIRMREAAALAAEDAIIDSGIQQGTAAKSPAERQIASGILTKIYTDVAAKLADAAKEKDKKAAIKLQAFYKGRLVRVKDVLGKLRDAKRQDAKKPVKYLDVQTHTLVYKTVQAVDAAETNQYGKVLQSITLGGHSYYKIKGLTTVYSFNGTDFIRMPKGTAPKAEGKDIYAPGVSGFVFVKVPNKADEAQLQARISYQDVSKNVKGEQTINFNGHSYRNDGDGTAYKLQGKEIPVESRPVIAQCVINQADLEALQKGEAMPLLALGDSKPLKSAILFV